MAKYFAEIVQKWENPGDPILGTPPSGDTWMEVTRVIVVESAELANRLLGGEWVETFMDMPYSHNYAGKGYIYYPDKENFSPPQPYPSWTLNDDCNWCPPTPMPTDGKLYRWNEDTLEWIEVAMP